MQTSNSLRTIVVRAGTAVILTIAATLLMAGSLSARTLFCNNNSDYFSKRCTVHPYAVTRVEAGNLVKGHLIGCQFKSYTCINGLCQDNYGPFQINYSISMDDHQGFCALLCRDPICTDPQGWR
ncbi:hypothetical protein SAMN05660653_01996 [Desulfonatronum thiosulfatophilum]|uniref:Uncharacterized protein n=1 Tax=Desulfonatronum thiosulfatophilum TaxID=617002 RepID=A0A1G6D810_9BACT|nr:hypothetical protein [Desulfonatronum thiosulfatophilum]SDB41306.1 hypothetical protein SAMN05660653_01996 [Desulfonatronum thiosulfatophilum]